MSPLSIGNSAPGAPSAASDRPNTEYVPPTSSGTNAAYTLKYVLWFLDAAGEAPELERVGAFLPASGAALSNPITKLLAPCTPSPAAPLTQSPGLSKAT